LLVHSFTSCVSVSSSQNLSDSVNYKYKNVQCTLFHTHAHKKRYIGLLTLVN